MKGKQAYEQEQEYEYEERGGKEIKIQRDRVNEQDVKKEKQTHGGGGSQGLQAGRMLGK